MSEKKGDENPFAGLFDQGSEVSAHGAASDTRSNSRCSSNEGNLEQKINSLIEKVFLITLNKKGNAKRQLVLMEEITNQSERDCIDLTLLEQALFERLLLPNPKDFLIPSDRMDETTHLVTETKAITYLYRAFEENEKDLSEHFDPDLAEAYKKVRELIILNASTAMKQPELFEGQSLSFQWLGILQECHLDVNYRREFLYAVTKDLFADDAKSALGYLKIIFYPMFSEILKTVRNANMITLEKWVIPILFLFVSDKSTPQLGELVLDFSTPNPDSEGVRYAETLFGELLSLSILPKKQNGRYEFYENPVDLLNATLNASLWDYFKNHLNAMYGIFKALLVLDTSVKNKTLSWIGNCLHANLPRGQIWNTHNLAALGAFTNASDAFMIGFCGILLRLCVPLLKPSFKVMLVDPTYCAVDEASRLSKNVHMKKASEETCLLPTNESETRVTATTYNFITEIFFMTHKAIDLSYRVCIEKYFRMSREMHRLQGALQDAMSQGQTEVAQNMTQILTTQTQQFMCLKSTLTEPHTDGLLLNYYEATAIWLTEISSKSAEVCEQLSASGNFAPKERLDLPLPLPPYLPVYLKSIPEYILENVIGYLTVMRHFGPQALELDTDAQSAIFRMILIFMGSVERVRNPHLRARLAEGLECFVPKEDNFRSPLKTNLFLRHQDRLQIVPNLLNVFVSIEMTGQSVQFEQKFNYRRPMYSIMEFLWDLDEQKKCFKHLAIEAQKNIEAVDPPIFLRFVNLLINDAIFLLDESLSNLQQIRTLQSAQDSGEWNSLPSGERQQNIANLQHLGMMARFDNILGRDTINILKLITTTIKEIFCHVSMVDRVAAMLNYFLLNLVGPKKGNFKVKDKKEFEFDPAHTVMDICRIYVNLSESDEFCLAVSQDGRSYSDELFDYAEQVLARIGGGQLIAEINELSMKIKRIEQQHRQDQEALADAPDMYLDPIMSTLMLDPVILPSSRVTVDRSTIARHLLSDQTDPFNRSPLTMDQIKPNVELRKEIGIWMEKKRKEYGEKQLQSENSSE